MDNPEVKAKTFAAYAIGAAACAVVLAALASVGVLILVGHHADSVLTQTDATLNEINRPCKGPEGPEACGVLASLNKTQNTTRHLIGGVDLVVEHYRDPKKLAAVDAGVVRLYSLLQQNLNNIDGGITDTRNTIKAIGGTADAASGLLNQGKDTVKKAGDLTSAATLTVKHADAAVTGVTPDIQRAAKGAAVTAEQTGGVATDAHKVADHYEQEIDNPKTRPWYIKMLPVAAQDIVQAMLTKWSLTH